MSQVVVTGGTGFVGANLVRRLIQDGHQPVLFVRPGFASWRIESIRRQITVHEVDVGDAAGLVSAIDATRPKWVFHLAAHGAYSWEKDDEQMYLTNVVGTANLLEATSSVGVEAFVNTGSSSEYGRLDHAPVRGRGWQAGYALWDHEGCRHGALPCCRIDAHRADSHPPSVQRVWTVRRSAAAAPGAGRARTARDTSTARQPADGSRLCLCGRRG